MPTRYIHLMTPIYRRYSIPFIILLSHSPSYDARITPSTHPTSEHLVDTDGSDSIPPEKRAMLITHGFSCIGYYQTTAPPLLSLDADCVTFLSLRLSHVLSPYYK